MSHILRTSTEHITAPLAYDGKYAYCQSTRLCKNYEKIVKCSAFPQAT